MYNNWQSLGAFGAFGQPQTGYGHQGLAAAGQALMTIGLDPIGNPQQQQQQQQMYSWFYNQWQQNVMVPQQAYPGMMQQQQQYPPLPEGSQNAPPAPPVEPPADVKPPLPPEPPPEEKIGSSQARQVLPALPPGPQLHAGKESPWQEQKPPPPQNQWKPPPPPAEESPSQPPAPSQPGRAGINPLDPLLKAALENLLKEEQEFVTQYDQWKKQYHEWQDQNKNHPNKEQFDQYLSQWKHYEQQMEERRHDIFIRKREIEEKIHVCNTPGGGLPTADPNKAGMGSQQRGQPPQDPGGKFSGSVLPGAPTPGERAMDSRFIGRGVPGQDPSGNFVGSMQPGAPPQADQDMDSRFTGRCVPVGNSRPGLQANGMHNSQQDRSADQRESSLMNQERWHNQAARDISSKPSLLGDKPPGLLGDKPPNLLGDKPPSLLGDKPSLLGDKPPSLLGDKPPSLLGDKPPSLLGDKPSSAPGHHIGPAYSDGSQGFGQRGPGGVQRPDQSQFIGPQKGAGHTGLLGDAPSQFQGQPGEDNTQAGQGKGKLYPGGDMGEELVEGGEDDMDLEENHDQEDFEHGFSNHSLQHFQGGPGPQRFPGPPPQRFQGPPHQQGLNMRPPGPQSFRPQGPQDFAGQGGRGQPPRGPQGLQGPGQRFPGPMQRFPGPGPGFRGPSEQQGFEQQDTDMSFQDFSSNNIGRGSNRGRGGSAEFGQRGRGFGQGNAGAFRGRGALQGPVGRDSFNEQGAFGAEYGQSRQFGEENEEGAAPEDAFREGGMGRGGPDNFRGHGGRGRGRGAPESFAGRGASQDDHVWTEPGREMGLRGRGGMPLRGRGASQGMAGSGHGYGEQDFGGERFEAYSEKENVEEGGELDQYEDEQSEDFQGGQQNFDESHFQTHSGLSGPSFRGGPGWGVRMQGPHGRGAPQGSYRQHPSRGGPLGQFIGRGGPLAQFSGPGGPQGQFGGRGGPQGQFEGPGGPQGQFRGRGGPRGQFGGMGRGHGVGMNDWEGGSQNQGYQDSGEGQPEDEQQDEWANEDLTQGEDQIDVPEEDSSLVFGIRGGGDGHAPHFPPPGSGLGNRFHGPPGPSERFGGPGSPANRFSAPPGSRFPAQGMAAPTPRFPGPGNERPRFPGPPSRGGQGGAIMGPLGRGGFPGQMRGPRPLMSMVFDEHEMEHRLSRSDEDGEGARTSDFNSAPGDASFQGLGSAGDKGEMDQPYSGNQHGDSRETLPGGSQRQQGRFPAGLSQGLGLLRQGAGARQAGPEGRELFSGTREQGPEQREPVSDLGKPMSSGRGRDPMLAQRGPLSDQAEQMMQRESMLGRRNAVPGVRGPVVSEERDGLPLPDEWVKYDGPERGAGTARDQVSTHDYGHGAVKGRGMEERWPVQESDGKLLGPGRPFQHGPGGQEDLDLMPRPPFPADDWPPREAPVRDTVYDEHLRHGRPERHVPLDRYGRPLRDPCVDRLGYDPYLARDPALVERRFRDPYMDPFVAPWMRDREHLADTERAFRPAESIDYGHGQGSGSRMSEDTPRAAPQVIDYGHGNKKDDSSRLSDAGSQDGFPKSDRPDWSEKRFSRERSQERPRSTDREHLEKPSVKSGRHDASLNEYGHHSYDHRSERERLDLLDDRDRLDSRGREFDRGRPEPRSSFERGEFDGADRGRWPERPGSPERVPDKRERDWLDRSGRSERLDQLERTDRPLDREWPGRFSRPERSDHSDADWARSSRREEFDRTDRSDWPSRERTDQPDRVHDGDRPDRRNVPDHFDRPDPGGWPDRPANPDIHERDSFWNDRPPRRDLPDWNDRSGFERGSERPEFRHRDFDRLREAGPGGPNDRSPSRLTPPPAPQPEAEFVKVEDLICMPGRKSRPSHIVIIVRGLPGSGKTYVSKLLREKEMSNGGGAARMLCLDDYFMVEQENKEVDPETGKKVTKKILEYEYEQDMEDAYRQSLFKSFKKTVDDGFFPFIVVDATNEKVAHFEEFWGYAKSKGFQVYVAEMEADVPTCINRNIHKWTEYDIEKVKTRWEKTPPHILRLDIRWLLQEDSITEVEMEDAPEEKKSEEEDTSGQKRKKEEEEEEEEEDGGVYKKSKWELDTSEVRLDKLDGLSHGMHKRESTGTTMEDYLQLPDDYFARKTKPGKKMVRWADLEERKEQSRRRDLGFVVGQTQRDWERITDDSIAEKALNQTKYI